MICDVLFLPWEENDSDGGFVTLSEELGGSVTVWERCVTVWIDVTVWEECVTSEGLVTV